MISLIAALALPSRGIGIDGHLPWRLPKDMARFKEITTGHRVIMGRTTWESLPMKYRPLPDRENIVVTRNLDFNAPGAEVCHSLEHILQESKEITDEVFIIGGAQIYAQTLDHADRLYLTLINKSLSTDVVFPEYENLFPNIIFQEEVLDDGIKTIFQIRE